MSGSLATCWETAIVVRLKSNFWTKVAILAISSLHENLLPENFSWYTLVLFVTFPRSCCSGNPFRVGWWYLAIRRSIPPISREKKTWANSRKLGFLQVARYYWTHVSLTSQHLPTYQRHRHSANRRNLSASSVPTIHELRSKIRRLVSQTITAALRINHLISTFDSK